MTTTAAMPNSQPERVDDAAMISTAKANDACISMGLETDTGGSGASRVLYTPEDDEWFSEPLCLTRQQIEAFAATPDDVKARSSFGGRNVEVAVGRVGIRCIHCAHLPPKERAPGAVTYPKSVRIMHQAVRNWQRYHFLSCNEIPAAIKEKFQGYPARGAQSKKNAAKYWLDSCHVLGMVDTDGDGGIRFVADKKHDGVKDASASNATEGGGRFVEHSVASSTGKNTETVQTNGSSEHDAAVNLQTLGNEITPLDANGPFVTDLASIDTDILEHLNFSQESCDAYGLIDSKDGSELVTNHAPRAQGSDLAGGFCSESKPWDVLPDEKAGKRKNDASLETSSFVNSVTPTETEVPLVAPVANQAPAQQIHAFVESNMADHPNNVMPINSSSLNIKGLQISAENDVQDERATLLESLRLSSELVKTVRVGHEKGLAYEADVVEAEFSALSGDQIRTDLVHVGVELYKLFSGLDIDPPALVDPPTDEMVGSDDDDAHGTRAVKKKRERRPIRQECIPLRDLGLPVSLSILVSSLLDAKDNAAPDRYHTAEEVEEDLRLMSSDPGSHFFDANADKQTGRLEFLTGKLYGRQHHVTRLIDVFGRSIGLDGPRELVLLTGYSGTGKTVLVDQLREPLVERNGHFISGKFDELGQVQPMSVIFTAFNDFCNDLLRGDEGQLSQIRMAITAALGPHLNVLIGAIPNLRDVIGEPVSAADEVGGREAQKRFYFCFRLFVRALGSSSHPVILFLDDLQWADRAALELIRMLVSDVETHSFLFVGSYRDNEVGADHPINSDFVDTALAGVTITKVKLENIGRESVNEMISDALHLMPRLTSPLACVVYAKTSGNPLFAVQFLRSLCDEHLLQYSAISRRWEWDVEMIQSKDIADNVVGLMSSKVLKLDPDLQRLLKDAACLGSRSEASTLKFLGADGTVDELGTMILLEIAVSEGLMSRSGTSYKFSHDQIQQAAYSLIPPREREASHLRIGRLLWRRASKDELNNEIFIIVDQLHRGSGLISDHAEKVEVAELCLMAGEKAMSSSAFMQASIYLLQGTVLLDESDWDRHYDLCLQVFSYCAFAQYAAGNNDGVTITMDPIWKHGKSPQDKLQAYYTLMNSLGSQGKPFDAINAGLEVLAQLDVLFPNEINQNDVMADFVKTRAMLGKTTIKDISEMNQMQDTNIVAAMKILSILQRYAYQVNQQLMSLMVFREVQLTLYHGICKESPIAFAAFGSFLCMFDALEEGYRYGKLALSLLDQLNAKEYLSCVYTIVYSQNALFTEPVQAALPSLEYGYESGMAMGDNEWALTCANMYINHGLLNGSKLDTLVEKARAYMQQMKQHNHNAFALIQPFLQTILNLMGCSDDPTELTGESMDQEEYLTSALEKQQFFLLFRVYFFRMWLAYLFRRYDEAAEMFKKFQEMTKGRPCRLEAVAYETFYSGLVATVMARKGEEGEWRSIALGAREKMKTWAANSSWNFQHKLDLLNAEIAYLNGDSDGAAKAYGDAIRVAKEHGFNHEEALACERAGIFFSEKLSPVMATDYFERSHKCYTQWGAKSKVDDVLQILAY